MCDRMTTHEPYIVAAHITGKVTPMPICICPARTRRTAKTRRRPQRRRTAKRSSGRQDARRTRKRKTEDDALAGKEPQKTKINVVLVADIDWILAPDIFRIREAGQDEDDSSRIEFKFQNIPFVLNILDSLAGDDRFIDLRKRTRTHRMLDEDRRSDRGTAQASARRAGEVLSPMPSSKIEAAERGIPQEDCRPGEPQGSRSARAGAAARAAKEFDWSRLATCRSARLEKDRNKKVKQSERELAAKIRGVQDRYKLLAVLLPPIPPILLAFFVFFHRRKAEQEGVDTRRLRFGRAAG